MNSGVASALCAYIIWGLLPIFWRSLKPVPPVEILAHRMAWSLAVVLPILAWKGHWRWLWACLRHPAVLIRFTVTALLLTVNWFLYIWAVNAGHIIETSLGYFMNPLINVLLGRLFLGERLRPGQAAAIALAVLGVIYMTISLGTLPWIGLVLGGTFGLYGLLRKTAKLGSLEGLTLETLISFVPSASYLLFLEATDQAALSGGNLALSILLPLAGLVTAFPLLLFASAARKITLTTMGVIQYITPTLQFLLGAFVYGEALTTDRLVGFGFIWTALLIYTSEGVLKGHQAARLTKTLGPR